MRIAYSSTWLAPGGLNGARDVQLNDQQLVQAVQLPRALAALFLARGNRATDFSFTVARFFDTAGAAALFMLTHRNGLPDTAALTIDCGGEGEASVYVALPDAVLASVGYASGNLRGTSLLVTYRFQGGLFVSAEPPDLEPFADMIRRATIAIPNAAQEVPVVFSSPLPSIPQSVQGLVIKPDSGADDLFVTGLVGAPTIYGCTFRLSAPAPTGTYQLSYTALV